MDNGEDYEDSAEEKYQNTEATLVSLYWNLMIKLPHRYKEDLAKITK